MWQREHFFQYRARTFNIKYGTRLTGLQLWGLWKKQRGCCAITGHILHPLKHRGVALDHIVARSKNGPPELSNLQWIGDEVNFAKSTLSSEEFVELCADVVAHAASQATTGWLSTPAWLKEYKECGIGLP
jgi:hypothetical protein